MTLPKFKVCVRCFTFNQSEYICDTLNGFVKQRTDFPYICCIFDDASTDGEQNIVKKYVDDYFDRLDDNGQFSGETDYAYITFSRHKLNKNCFFVVIYLKENHHSIRKSKDQYLSNWTSGVQYLALCEGDDYWTDCNKLSKQVAVLEQNPQCSFCTHAYSKLLSDGTFMPMYDISQDFQFSFKRYFSGWYTQLLTSMIRADCYPGINERNRYKDFKDRHLFFLLLTKGEGYFLHENMGVYRITGNGVWTSMPYEQKMLEEEVVYMELCRDFPNNRYLRKICRDIYTSHKLTSLVQKQPMRSFVVKGLPVALRIYFYVHAYYVYIKHCIKICVKSS